MSLYMCNDAALEDEYIIKKFDDDINFEHEYEVSSQGCTCPAGHRPTCRHRQMIHSFLQECHISDGWLFDFDRNKWQEPVS